MLTDYADILQGCLQRWCAVGNPLDMDIIECILGRKVTQVGKDETYFSIYFGNHAKMLIKIEAMEE